MSLNLELKMQQLTNLKITQLQELQQRAVNEFNIPLEFVQKFISNIGKLDTFWICSRAYKEIFNKYYQSYDLFVGDLLQELEYNVDYIVQQDPETNKPQYLIAYTALKQLEMKSDKQCRQYYALIENLLLQISKTDQQIKEFVNNWCKNTGINETSCGSNFTMAFNDKQNTDDNIQLGVYKVGQSSLEFPIYYAKESTTRQQKEQYDRSYDKLTEQCLKYCQQKNKNTRCKNVQNKKKRSYNSLLNKLQSVQQKND